MIIVTLNAGDNLKTTVYSVLSQTMKDYEILIKDGGSTDGCLDFINDLEDDRIRVVAKPDTSIYDGMNHAVKEARGDYFIFMNAGDVFADNKVLVSVTKFLTVGRYNIVYGDMRRKGQDTIIPYPDKLTDFGLFRNVPCHQVCFYDRKLFAKRGYSLKLKVRSDYEHFLWCIYKEKAVTGHINRPICIYEGGGFSETDENIAISKMEHRIITDRYQGRKAGLYRLIMIITLQPVREKIAANQKLSGIYQGLKKLIYSKSAPN